MHDNGTRVNFLLLKITKNSFQISLQLFQHFYYNWPMISVPTQINLANEIYKCILKIQLSRIHFTVLLQLFL